MVLFASGTAAGIINVFGIPFSSHIAGLAIGTVVFIIPFLAGEKMGAGDVKYTGVAGLFLGYPDVLLMVVLTCAALLLWIGAMFVSGNNVLKKKVPVGPFISFAFVTTLVVSNI